MNSDIRLSVGFFDHPKTIKLKRQLGHEGVTALMRLWLWVAQNRPNGILSGMDEDDIEIAARWNGVQGAFNAAVTNLRFLNCVDGVYQIHDWQEHNAWQSDAENRSNASRLSRMARAYPEIYALLEHAGIKGISKEIYGIITTSNDPKTITERLLTTVPSPFLTSPYLSSPLHSLPLQGNSLSEPDGTDEKIKLHSEVLPNAQEATKTIKLKPMEKNTEAYQLAILMRDTLKVNLPTFKEPNLHAWAKDFDVALRNDERMKEASFVAEVIKWACSDGFWRGNIQSPAKLREKFDQLTAKMENEVEKARAASKTEKWKSPAQRRLEANEEAGREAKRLLFGDPAEEVMYDAK